MKFLSNMNILSFDVGSFITCWFRKCLNNYWLQQINKYYIVVILRMYGVVSGYCYIPKWAGPTSESTFYSTKNHALSEWIGFKKIKDGAFEQFESKHWQIWSISKKKLFDIVKATLVNIPSHLKLTTLIPYMWIVFVSKDTLQKYFAIIHACTH